MAGDTSKFLVEFQADVKKYKAAMADLRRDQDKVKRDTKTTQSQEQQGDRVKTRVKQQVRKEDDRGRKTELNHVRLMKREELSRHKLSLGLIQRGHSENQRLMKRTSQLEKQLAKQQGGGGKAGGGGFWKGLGVGAAGGIIASSAWNMLSRGATAGYQLYNEYGATMGRNVGLGSGRDIKRGVRGAMGGKLGFSQIESAAMVPLMARSTGQLGPRELQQGQRATGMEAGEVGDVFGTIRRAGYDFGGAGKGTASRGGNEFKKLIAAGMASGLEKGRFPEFAHGVQQLVEQQRALFTGNINVGDIAKTLAAFGMSGKPGMQGQAGASLFGKVSGAIAGGGDEWSQGLFLRSMGFGKPGGNTGYYEAEKRRESAGRDPSVVMDVMKQMAQEFGGFGGEGKEEAGLSMRQAFGVTLEQAEALQDIYSSSENMDAKLAQVSKIMEGSKSIEEQSLDNMKNIGEQAKRIAELTNRGIDIGAKSAHVIEAVEEVQYKILKALIRVAEGVESIFNEIKGVLKNGSTSSQASNQVDDADRLQSEGRRAKTAKGAVAAYKQAFLTAKAARDQAGESRDLMSWGGAAEAISDIASGDFAGSASAKKQAQLAAEAQRKGLLAGGSYAAAKMLNDAGVTKFSAEDQKFISAAGKRAVNLGSLSDQDALFEGLDMPSSLTRRKKTNSGTVKTPDADSDVQSGASDGAATSSNEEPLKFSLMVGTSDARIQPSMSSQNPGSPSMSATRGVG